MICLNGSIGVIWCHSGSCALDSEESESEQSEFVLEPRDTEAIAHSTEFVQFDCIGPNG